MSYPYRDQYQYDRVPSRRRVVITGLGAVSAAGVGVKPLWEALLSGKSCIGPLTRIKPEGMPISIAGEVRDFDPAKYLNPALRPKRMARHTQFAVVAAQEALADAGLDSERLAGLRVAVVIGATVGTPEIMEEVTRQIERGASRGIVPSTPASANLHAAPAAVAEMLGTRNTPATGITNACSSGADAVSIAADMIRLGRRDVIVTGGADAPLSDATVAALVASGICTKRHANPTAAVRPFDRERDGGVPGEGAGIVVLEELESARARGSKIYAEILSTYSCPDEDRTRPTSGLELTMRGALENAGCQPADVDYISAWGCGDPSSDRCETVAIKAALGEDAYRVAVGSIKGTIGIPLAASGALQLVMSAVSHRDHILLPTVNCERPDFDCDLDYIAFKPRRLRLRKSLLNAHGLNGSNVSLLLSSV